MSGPIRPAPHSAHDGCCELRPNRGPARRVASTSVSETSPRTLGGRFESGMEPKDSRSISLDPMRATLHPKGDDGIDPQRTARRHVAGDERHEHEDQGDEGKDADEQEVELLP